MQQTTPWKRKACVACTRAKRQCNKACPTCRRCREKGIACTYPFTRQVYTPATDSLYETGIVSDGVEINESLNNNEPKAGLVAHSILTPVSHLAEALPGSDLAQSFSSLTAVPIILHESNDWFLRPESWTVKYGPDPCEEPRLFGDNTLKHAVRLQADIWPKQWVEKGHNTFIHKNLYRYRMPRCMQDAYTTMAAFVSRTPDNENLVDRILLDRATQLVEEQVMALFFSPLDILDHIARTQALLMYEAISLFSSNIRLRTRAEQMLPTLADWVQQMLDTAAAQFGSGAVNMSPSSIDGFGTDPIAASWRMWIMTESIRRTCFATKILQGVYMSMRGGWSECAGSVHITSRQGLWGAPSAYTWHKQSKDGDPLFLDVADAHCLFTQVKYSDVDEFTRMAMFVIFGLEPTERWAGELMGQDGPE